MSSSSSEILPGFSAEQTASLTRLIQHTLREALEPYFGPLPQYKQPVSVPKPASQEQAQQATAEDSSESTTKKRRRRKKKKSTVSSSSPVNTSPLSTVPRPCTMSTLRESTSCLSTARIQHAPNLAPILAFQHAQFLAWLASPLNYIRDAKEMEATGQG